MLLTMQTRREYVKIAEELCYPQNVVDKIKHALTDDEVQHIMIDARHNMGVSEYEKRQA